MKASFLMMSMMMILLLMILTYKMVALISEHSSNKWSTFECGFTNTTHQRNIFSTQFFMIMVLFLIFDIEISLLFPIPIQFSQSAHNLFMTMFLMMLLIGLIYEWKSKKLNWSI